MLLQMHVQVLSRIVWGLTEPVSVSHLANLTLLEIDLWLGQ